MGNVVKLKVAEAIQDDVNKGIVRIDSTFMHELDVRPEDIVEIKGEKTTLGIIDRAYPGDIGLNIIRMDGLVRRNARAGIGEYVEIKKANVLEAKNIVISPLHKEIRIEASPKVFKYGLVGRAVVSGDIVSLGGSRKKKKLPHKNGFFDDIDAMDSILGFGLSDLKFVVSETNPKQAVVITENTEITYNPQPQQPTKEDKLLEVTYEDIGGLSEEVTKVREMVELPLKHPEIFERLGIDPPKGVLMYGPPGTGKTLLAKAVANETQANFIVINGPEIMGKFYGQSEQNLRKIFENAEKNGPSIIFIDEIDAIATKREETHGEVERRVVAQLLALMDGLKSRGRVVVIAASNIPNSLDPALRRPGRFDREIEIGVPDTNGRNKILQIHTRNMPIDPPLFQESILNSTKYVLNNKKDKLPTEIENKTKSVLEIEKLIEDNRVDLKNLEDKVSKLSKDLEELNIRKSRADENLLHKIIESIKGLNSKIDDLHAEITNSKNSINTNLNLISRKEKEKENLNLQMDIIKELLEKLNDDSFSNELAENLKLICESNFSHNDPRFKIIENTVSQFIENIKKLDLFVEISDLSKKYSKELFLLQLSENTHGFVGADLYALCKEAAMNVLRRVLPDINLDKVDSIPTEDLEKLYITEQDFKEARKVVHPSAMREVLVEIPSIKWDDIGGLSHLKQDLLEAVEWPLKHPEVFTRLGINPPKGILIYGPPGTGKTLLAKAVANESKANFISIKGPELLSKWVNETPQLVKKLFLKAKEVSPCIIFIDEIDSVAGNRDVSGEDTNKGMNAINQLLTEMDGLEELNDVIVIATTNRPDIMDPALLRPGRFDRIILASVPDNESRKDIFRIHTKNMPIVTREVYLKNLELKEKSQTLANENNNFLDLKEKDIVDLDDLATITEGFVGADIEFVCREAAILALRENINTNIVSKNHFLTALEKVKPSVTKEVSEVYEKFDQQHRQAIGKTITNKQNYFG